MPAKDETRKRAVDASNSTFRTTSARREPRTERRLIGVTERHLGRALDPAFGGQASVEGPLADQGSGSGTVLPTGATPQPS